MEVAQNKTVENFWKGFDETIDEWFLMSTPGPVLLITASYLLFVIKLGPEFMKKRQPYSLSNVLLVYNILQVLMSFFILCLGIKLQQPVGIIHSVCELKKDVVLPVATGIHYYLIAKLIELLDTIFFVLRKKYNQVTFLHVYHHAFMFLASWWNVKYEPTYATIFLGTLNSGVHVIMYSYYALSTFPSLTKYLWWKKYITSIQLIQFLLIILQVSANYFYSGCPPSYSLFTLIIINTSLMIYLFSDFYIKAYNNKQDQKMYQKKTENRPDNKMDNGFAKVVENISKEKLFEKTH